MKYVISAIKRSGQLPVLLIHFLCKIFICTLGIQITIFTMETLKDPSWNKIAILGAMSLGIVISNNISTYCRQMMPKYVYNKIHDDFIEKLTTSDYQLYVKFTPGEIYNIWEHIGSVSQLIWLFQKLVDNTLQVVIVLSSIHFINKKILLPVFVIYVLGSISLVFVFKKWTELDTLIIDKRRERNKYVDDLINGFKEMISSHTNAIHRFQIISSNNTVMKYLKKKRILHMLLNGVIDIADHGSFLLVIILMMPGLTSGAVDVGLAYASIMIISNLTNPMINLADLSSDYSECKAPLPKLLEFLNYDSNVKDGKITLESFDEKISIENMSFGYDTSSTVLNNISIEIKKGQHIGICGPTGGGKSTLLKLIPRFYDLSQGSIKIDGIDIRELSIESLINRIGIVHQDTFIFDNTIAKNILYPMAGKSVTREELIEACKKAQIYDFIMSLPEKFDTQVGARGLKLSGGQKQRIALARIFLSNKDIILLDEATSALDNKTESLVQEALDLFKDKTMIIVAHRLTTIKDCDQIYLIANHEISEQGTHVELVEMGGKYAAMLGE